MNSQSEIFSDNPFMIGYDNRIFEGDSDLGFRFPQGKLITSNGFCSLEEIIEQIKRNTGYPIILNVGDSSTSGWNSDRTFKGNKDINSPFFTYKTYSDLMREQFFANVINVGVPGYTSLQGNKILLKLLKSLARFGITPDYVTIYFGNNDGTYNQHEDKVRLDFKKKSPENKGERVIVEDFKKNLTQMVDITRDYGAMPILIVPPVRYDWEPGVRSQVHRDEFEEALMNANSYLKQEVETARKLYFRGKLILATELDRVLPRIKSRYRKSILQIGRQTRTRVIDIQSQIKEGNSYFIDYCHPNERTNQLIIDKFKEIMDREMFRKEHPNLIYSFFKKCFVSKHKKEDNSGLPTDIYTLY